MNWLCLHVGVVLPPGQVKQGQLFADPVTALGCRAVVWLLAASQAGSHQLKPLVSRQGSSSSAAMGTSVVIPTQLSGISSSCVAKARGLSSQAEHSSPLWSAATKARHDHTPEKVCFSICYRKILQTSTQAKMQSFLWPALLAVSKATLLVTCYEPVNVHFRLSCELLIGAFAMPSSQSWTLASRG